ncbi:ECHDC3 [Cordylochernes scorpioides]|uniref:Enoyl-CoA hydratase domain-containing protein 3, mitochondrial n=1 Tax=Cordylochernes scorpioides TaxID=51811 RepID=A0ABY6L7P9_9ARAC|nr:ECHDC3 [Cordylochernes scorpioides]
MMEAIHADRTRDLDSLRCIVISSTGPVFSSGHDLKELYRVNFGLFCSTPGIALARAVPRKMAAYMLLTGRPISATEALRCGLVSHVVPESQLQDLTEQIIKDIQNKSRAVVAQGKEFFYHQIQHPVESAYQDGTQAMVENLGLKDCGAGLKAFFEKKAPEWSHKN